VSRENAVAGLKVVRGPDWKWGDQDGGTGNVGTLIAECGSDGWVKVCWPSGTKQSYRAGKDGCYDLVLAAEVVAEGAVRTDPVAVL
jgi:E3 ubiquitin-protein ligase HERC2